MSDTKVNNPSMNPPPDNMKPELSSADLDQIRKEALDNVLPYSQWDGKDRPGINITDYGVSQWIRAVTAERLRIKGLERELKEAREEVERLKISKPVQLCPKCHGTGVMSRPPGVPADVLSWSSSASVHTCDICNGRKTVS